MAIRFADAVKARQCGYRRYGRADAIDADHAATVTCCNQAVIYRRSARHRRNQRPRVQIIASTRQGVRFGDEPTGRTISTRLVIGTTADVQ